MSLLQLILGEVNWTNISADWVTYIISGYTDIFGEWFYPLVFIGFIGYVYCINKSAIAAAAAICIIFTVFSVTGIFATTDEFTQLASGVSLAAFAGLFALLFYAKRASGEH